MGPAPRPWWPAFDADQDLAAGRAGDGLEKTNGVRVTRAAKDGFGGSVLDEATGVEHRGLVGELCDDRQVVADVHRGHLVLDRHLPHGFQNSPLCGHVEARGGFVENDHTRPATECHGDSDALLLTT